MMYARILFSGFLHRLVLAKLATSSIWVITFMLVAPKTGVIAYKHVIYLPSEHYREIFE